MAANNVFKVLRPIFKDKYATKFDKKVPKPELCTTCGGPIMGQEPHVHIPKVKP